MLPSFRCPDCGLAGADVIRGDELEVESIEVVDNEEERCIAHG
jgi:Zn finger protein HypA/HybF involved in hydrogenase expression